MLVIFYLANPPKINYQKVRWIQVGVGSTIRIDYNRGLQKECMRHIQYFLQQTMSEGEDTFELLISTEDYLKLQARCEELEKLQEKQKKQYRELSTKIYDIKEEKEQLSLKNIGLDAEVAKLNQANNQKEERINSCNLELECLRKMLTVKEKEATKSQQALLSKVKQMDAKLAAIFNDKKQVQNKVLQISSQFQNQLTNKKYLQNQIEILGKKIKELTSELHDVTGAFQSTLGELEAVKIKNKKLQSELNDYAEQLSKSSKLIKEGQLLAQENSSLVQSLKRQLSLAKDETARISHQLQQEIESTQIEKNLSKKQISQLKKSLNEQIARVNQKQKDILDLEAKLAATKNELGVQTQKLEELMLETENQRFNFVEKSEDLRNKCEQKQRNFKNELQKMKKTQQQKITLKNVAISELQQEIIKLNSQKVSSEQNLKNRLKQTEFAMAKQKQTFINLQKEYEEIITSMQEEKKSSKVGKENQKDQLKIVKSLLQQYFTNLALNLYEIGNLDSSDIKGILSQQEEIVKQYISDVIQAFILNTKKPVVQHYRAQP